MASKRKSVKFDLSSENKTLNYSQCANSPMNNKIPKLTYDEPVEGNSRINTKLVSTEKRVESYFVTTQKTFNVVDQQLTKRNKSSENLLTSLLDIISQMKADNELIKQNGQTLAHLMSKYMRYIKLTAIIRQRNLRKLDELINTYKIESEKMHSEENPENMKLTGMIINQLYEAMIGDAENSD